MRPSAVRLLVEVDEELWIERIAAVVLPAELGQPAPDLRVELVVPGREQRVGEVHAIAVERVLEHLRSAVQRPRRFRVTAVAAEEPAEPDLRSETRVGRIEDVVVAQIPV